MLLHIGICFVKANSLPLLGVDVLSAVEVWLFSAMEAAAAGAAARFFLGTGLLLPEGVALVPVGPSSQEDVEDPDSSSEDKVGGWSPVCVL